MADEQWYYTVNGAQQGPVSTEQMRALIASATVNPSTLVWTASMTEWKPLGQSPLATAAGSFASPPAMGMAAAPSGYPAGPAPMAYPGQYGAAPYSAGGAAPPSPGFVDAIKICFSKYARWAGRATRSEYWWFALFYVILVVIGTIIDVMLFGGSMTTNSDGTVGANFSTTGAVSSLVVLAMFLPTLAVMIRRLHDTNRSGWWFWIGLVPLVGPIVLLVFLCSGSTPGANRFG